MKKTILWVLMISITCTLGLSLSPIKAPKTTQIAHTEESKGSNDIGSFDIEETDFC